MRWIIWAHDKPAQLHALLESAENHWPGGPRPTIVIQYDGDQQLNPLYTDLAMSFRAYFRVAQSDRVRDVVLEVVNAIASTLPNEMILLTTDTQMFITAPHFEDAWAALQETTVTAFATNCPSPYSTVLSESGFRACKRRRFAWNWRTSARTMDEPFHAGWVYRAVDLYPPMANTRWSSQNELSTALNHYPHWPINRSRLVCRESPCMADVDGDDKTAIDRYIKGHRINIEAMAAAYMRDPQDVGLIWRNGNS